mgnify:CR=1 FL=1
MVDAVVAVVLDDAVVDAAVADDVEVDAVLGVVVAVHVAHMTSTPG